ACQPLLRVISKDDLSRSKVFLAPMYDSLESLRYCKANGDARVPRWRGSHHTLGNTEMFPSSTMRNQGTFARFAFVLAALTAD
ncbi:hypothetical protein MPH_10324, partial [Macrophomina phaseolina MS6]